MVMPCVGAVIAVFVIIVLVAVAVLVVVLLKTNGSKLIVLLHDSVLLEERAVMCAANSGHMSSIKLNLYRNDAYVCQANRTLYGGFNTRRYYLVHGFCLFSILQMAHLPRVEPHHEIKDRLENI